MLENKQFHYSKAVVLFKCCSVQREVHHYQFSQCRTKLSLQLTSMDFFSEEKIKVKKNYFVF